MTWIDQVRQFLSLPTDRLLAITAYGEASSEGGEGMAAILNVIRNRANNLGTFGDADILNATQSPYHAVILKKAQFSMFSPGNSVRPIAERLASNFDAEYQANSVLRTAYSLSQMLLAGTLEDNTLGATFYYNPLMASPSWAPGMVVVVSIGRHTFLSPTGPVYATLTTPVTEGEYPADESEYPTGEEGFMAAGFSSPLTIALLVGMGLGVLYYFKKGGF